MNIWILKDSDDHPLGPSLAELSQKGHSLTAFGPAQAGASACAAWRKAFKSNELPHIVINLARGLRAAFMAARLAKKHQAPLLYWAESAPRLGCPYSHNSHPLKRGSDESTGRGLEELIYRLLHWSPRKNEWKGAKPRVSVVLPCRNEINFIGRCLESIVNNDYPRDLLEVILVDGMSTDGSREVIAGYCAKNPHLKMLDNPKQEQQLAMNIGIKAATGEVILRMGAHDTYTPNYISACVAALEEHPADNVGGGWVATPRNDTFIGRAICFVMSVPFGVGNAYYRLTSLKDHTPYLHQPRWEIHIAYPCCRREVYETIGPFNERLTRSEDIDFRARIKEAGFRTLYVPTIRCHYLMRTRLKEFIRHMFLNGQWVFLPLNYAPNISFSLRHVIPFLFLILTAALTALSFFSSAFALPILALGGIYLALNTYFSARIAWRERNPGYFLVIPFLFCGLHLSYGLGSLVALYKIVKFKLVKERRT